MFCLPIKFLASRQHLFYFTKDNVKFTILTILSIWLSSVKYISHCCAMDLQSFLYWEKETSGGEKKGNERQWKWRKLMKHHPEVESYLGSNGQVETLASGKWGKNRCSQAHISYVSGIIPSCTLQQVSAQMEYGSASFFIIKTTREIKVL